MKIYKNTLTTLKESGLSLDNLNYIIAQVQNKIGTDSEKAIQNMTNFWENIILIYSIYLFVLLTQNGSPT